MRVRGVGPRPCAHMLVAEKPGLEEGRKGVPLVGKTGRELDRYLDGIDLPCREDLFLTNLYREFVDKDYEYTAEDLARDAPDLVAELHEVRPTFVLTMGREATRWFLGDVDMDDVHALPWYVPATFPHQWEPESGEPPIILPLYHIAAGFRNPDVAGLVSYDMQQAAAFFRGEIKPRTLYDDPCPDPYYIELVDPAQVVLDPLHPVYIDSEGWVGDVWSVQYSQQPGSAYVIRGAEMYAAFGRALAAVKDRVPVVYHSALHDLSVLRAIQIETNDCTIHDTQVMAYLLQVEPRGLKPLCVRHCNMPMRSYEEVMGDADNRLAYDYFISLLDIEEADYGEKQQEAFEAINRTPLLDKAGQPKRDKAGQIRYRATRVLPKLPKSGLHKAAERGLRSREPRKLWEKWEDDQPQVRVDAYNRLGDMPRATLDHVEYGDAIAYGARDADGTARLYPELSARIDAMGLREVYNLEMATYPLIDRMQQIGIRPDLAHFKEFSRDLAFEIADLQVKLEQETGIENFNANSGDQVADYIFEQLGLEGYKRTESGRFSTNDKVLEALEHEHPEFPVITTIRSYREVYKLKHTFVDRIPDFTRRWPYDGRVHATFRTTRVVTGRLAASDPNLLAQPKHGKFARRFRRGWIAGEGHLLGEWDLSQIELRVLAHLSQDEALLRAFRTGVDLHAQLAQRIFGGKLEDHKKGTTRLAAKAINFGIPMGMTYKGLTVELRKNGVMVSEDDANTWQQDTMRLYAGVPLYQQRMIEEAKQRGYIRCLSGRIRYIGGIKSWDDRIRAEAERFAFSTPIQEGAQLLVKQAEASIWRDIVVPYGQQGLYVQPLLQVHDAIDLEFEPKVAKELNTRMCAIMTRAPKGFSVPVETSGDYGTNLCGWDDKETTFDRSAAGCGDMVPFGGD